MYMAEGYKSTIWLSLFFSCGLRDSSFQSIDYNLFMILETTYTYKDHYTWSRHYTQRLQAYKISGDRNRRNYELEGSGP